MFPPAAASCAKWYSFYTNVHMVIMYVLSLRASGGCDYNILTEAVCTHNIQSCWITAILLKEKLDHGEVTSFSSHSDRTI